MVAPQSNDLALCADDERPVKKARKQRPHLSCGECRRLKMKCDRQVPCSRCIRRQRQAFCEIDTPEPTDDRRQSRTQELSYDHNNETHALTYTQQYDNQPSHLGSSTLDAVQPYTFLDKTTATDSLHPLAKTAALQISDYHTNAEISLHDANNTSIAVQQFDSDDGLHRLAQTTPAEHEQAHAYAVTNHRGIISNGDGSEQQNTGQGESDGTLMFDRQGRSKYLGPTAGIEWLKDSEMQEQSETPPITRPPTPRSLIPQGSTQSTHLMQGNAHIAFPFSNASLCISSRQLISSLPPQNEALVLVESYFRYCAWHHDVAPKALFDTSFVNVYSFFGGAVSSPSRSNLQEIALVFIVLAQGTMFNIEMPCHDTSAQEWLTLAECALVKGEFLSHNTVAGLQTLHLMAHLQLQLDNSGRGDSAWPLWGLTMRLAQAMGMHRDGTVWDLPQDVAEERRKVFWECNAADTFQAHCFSRPAAINPEHCDTSFPRDVSDSIGEKGYSRLRFELSQLSSEILHMTMKVKKPTYDEVINVDLKLAEFEINVPYSLRCRAAYLAMPSRYPNSTAATEATPSPSRRFTTASFQQTNLALNISETIINLHRPYYAKALYNSADSRSRSTYMHSFLTVIERCTLLITIVADINARFPNIATRQWNFWYHVFGSALCLGTLVLRDPGNEMTATIMAHLDTAIQLFTSVVQHGATIPRYRRNLAWLRTLRTKLQARISALSTAERGSLQQQAASGSMQQRANDVQEDTADVELLGWRTRLVQRTERSQWVSTAILPHESRAGLAFSHEANRAVSDPGTTASDIARTFVAADTMDDILHDFWDPVLLQEMTEENQRNGGFSCTNNTEWWNAFSTLAP